MDRRLESRLNNFGNYCLIESGKKKAKEKELSDRKNTLSDLDKRKELLNKCSVFLRKCSTAIREAACKKLESIATLALQTITGRDYELTIDMYEARNIWQADLLLKTPEGLKIPIAEAGGGIANIIGLALQIAVLELYSPRIEAPLLLDEPFANVSLENEEWVERTIEFLRSISKKLKRQIIMVTHKESLAKAADKIYQFTIEKGETRVFEIQ